jgi:hypothetical protein
MGYLNGDLNYAKKILNHVLKKFPEHIEALNELAKGDNMEIIIEQANTMTGLASCTYTPPLQGICFKVETAAQGGNLASVRMLLPELENTARMTLKEIQAVVARISK